MNSQLLAKYFKGECSPKEVQEVLSWFHEQELDSEQEKEFDLLWQEAEKEKEVTEFTAGSASFFEKLNLTINKDEQEQRTMPIDELYQTKNTISLQRSWNWIFKVAAAVIIPLGFLWVYQTLYFSEKTNNSASYITFKAEPGIKKTIKLEDNSKVTLNSGSQITLLKHFPKDKREIKLKGEAFFEVAKDKQRPFIVKTGNISTQALGTSFNITNRQKENLISIALATGLVKIVNHKADKSEQIAKLIPGQQLVFNRKLQLYQVSPFDSLEVLGWRHGNLCFKKANLNQVVQKLETWYGVEIEIKGEIPAKKEEWNYTGSYQNQSLENVLKGIGYVKDFSYKKNSEKVTLKFN